MRRISLLAALIAMMAGAAATPAHAATAARTYVVAPHDSMAWATIFFATRVNTDVVCSARPNAPDLGGACLGLPAGVSSVTVEIRDARLPFVRGRVRFLDARGGPLGLGVDFCRRATVAVPRGATAVRVTVGESAGCGALVRGFGTTGKVFFRF